MTGTMSHAADQVATTATRRPPGSRVVAYVLAAMLLVVAIALRDIEAGVFAGLFAVAGWLLTSRNQRTRRIVRVLAGLLFVNVAGWMLPAAISNLRSGEPAFVPAALAAVAITGVVSLVGRALVAWAVGVALFAGLVAATTLAGGPVTTVDADLDLRSAGVAFTATELRAPAGDITARMANDDLFWHTFTIDELGVDLQVPVGGTRTATFTAAPGTYAYYCAIPGHAQAGMRGTLIVE